ncbi:MAG: hypothetical protein JJ891_16220 [Rhizobiaceae bacterium]|jgi:hypothetical protein|nr:hypothetical protein [Rhizobiaceae bacterium]
MKMQIPFDWVRINEIVNNQKRAAVFVVLTASPLIATVSELMGRTLPISFFLSFFSGILLLLATGVNYLFAPPAVIKYRNKDNIRRSLSDLISNINKHDEEHLNISAGKLTKFLKNKLPSKNIGVEEVRDAINESATKEIDPEVRQIESQIREWNSSICDYNKNYLLICNFLIIFGFFLFFIWAVTQIWIVIS